jgi:D-glycero-alpha-D-manno-heptose 1-phosphate guanylyltransferase
VNIPVIILAGGLGTRLKGVIKDVPKPMAPVNGRPFLHYIFTYLRRQGIKQVILSIGFKSESIKEYFGEVYEGISVLYMEEERPLGTGGGIYQAASLCEEYAYILNGDTFFDVDLPALFKFYKERKADIAMALKPMKDFERYGTVQLNGHDQIASFVEKKFLHEGLINGGVYLLNKDCFRKIENMNGELLPRKFSFETDILEKYAGKLHFYGKTCDNYFIDIGIPEDYHKVQGDFKSIFS